jgi:hypothetical protein
VPSTPIPIVTVGDRVRVYWENVGPDASAHNNDATYEPVQSAITCEVIEIKKRKSEKQGSLFTYTLRNVKDENDVRKTRLLHLRYKVKATKSASAALVPLPVSSGTPRMLPNFSFILAPMVTVLYAVGYEWTHRFTNWCFGRLVDPN